MNKLKYLEKMVEIQVLTQYYYLKDIEKYIAQYYHLKEYQEMAEIFKMANYELVLLQCKNDLLKFTKQEQLYIKNDYIKLIKINFTYIFNRLLINKKDENLEESINLIKSFYKILFVCIQQLHNELKNNKNVIISEIFLYFFSLQKIINNVNFYLQQQLKIYDINNKGFAVEITNEIDLTKEKENLDKIKFLILKNNQNI